MSAVFIFETKDAKKNKIFIFRGPMDMIFGVFSET